MTNTAEVSKELVFSHFEVEDGKLIGYADALIVEVDEIHRDGDGNVWVTYWHAGEKRRALHYKSYTRFDLDRVW
jgi:hypothetical protein